MGSLHQLNFEKYFRDISVCSAVSRLHGDFPKIGQKSVIIHARRRVIERFNIQVIMFYLTSIRLSSETIDLQA